MNNFDNINILITGASGGIGTSLSKAFSSTKANLFLLGSSDEKISSLREELPSRDNIRFFTVDLSQRENVNNFCDSIIEEFGGISVVINNAGITQDSLFMRMSDSVWDKVFAINLDASMAIIRKFIRGMIKNKWGRIVNISSVVASTGNPGQSNYVASKGALNGLTKSLALEVATRGVTVNCISPGFIDTAMTAKLNDDQRSKIIEKIPMGRMGVGDDISSLALFLASNESSYITGQNIHVNGGMFLG
ncbi:MAG: 3-oxoacyl-ACP reductase FabG [Paracoccaceae bacterium]|nr:MAG: SDR family NAD(P)-dependent oxidoreductase [Alphaproteobacteria bacterium]|tara:strand:+ start:8714 stop:9457 length:744 start_codon:yes stop_codon:yes gene_type:complete